MPAAVSLASQDAVSGMCQPPDPWAVGLGRWQALGRNAGSPIKLMPWQPGGPELLSRTAQLSTSAPLGRPSQCQALVSARPTMSLSLVPWVTTLNLSLFIQKVGLKRLLPLRELQRTGECLETPGPASVQAPSPSLASGAGGWRRGEKSCPNLRWTRPPPGLGALAS